MSSYKIAVATSDEKNIDCHFGSAEHFSIYVVDEDGNYDLVEKRVLDSATEEILDNEQVGQCSCRCSGQIPSKVKLIKDCRFLLCAAIGPGALRQLEAVDITAFDMDTPVIDTIEKLIAFYKNK